ncbi:UrcA family protein [Nguyenibacter vanlangensis]|uniref:UrcA family protein n=1 Tax=Nguyenibacter vanlangensis TaxID=1216886 RepID=A0A7Y7IVV6_9PROT|nr:UrcA family protein [Nguyenibacter vanlangensis]NVN11315.1 UrcA family protein [Nguyenibacter vanlangensis]
MNGFSCRPIGLGVAALLMLAPMAAMAQDEMAQEGVAPQERVTVEGAVQKVPVRYFRADLATEARARILVRRLDRAALEACGDSTAIAEDLRRVIARSACRRDAVMRAVGDVNDPTLYRAVNDFGLPQ